MNIVNIMNFVRGIDPRYPELDLVLPVREELNLCRKYGYKNTFLMQYDAMIRSEFVDVMKSADENTEIGVWVEIGKSLTDKVGLEWRGREGWDWDWHVNPGFLPAYTHAERELIIDEFMRNFKETFGYYPKSVASWVMDAYSMQYMQEKYDVSAFAICREQYGIDAYTLIGTYYNQAYYPSKRNNICPAQTKENQINAPVFKLLGPDPVYNYGSHEMYADALDTPPTIEPAWEMGQNPKAVDWFFDSYFGSESMAFSYIQLGQENPFGWDEIKKGLPMQLEKLKPYADSGKCSVMTMAESGEWFKQNFSETPATAIGAKNIIGNDINESRWYSCKNYRVNFVSEGDSFYIRDIYKFDENFTENYYDTPCEKWSIAYTNLPVMDGYLWRRAETNRAGIYFDGKYKSMNCRRENESYVIDAEFDDYDCTIVMTEDKITINTDMTIRFVTADDVNIGFEKHMLHYENYGVKYDVPVLGTCNADGSILPCDGKIEFVMKSEC